MARTLYFFRKWSYLDNLGTIKLLGVKPGRKRGYFLKKSIESGTRLKIWILPEQNPIESCIRLKISMITKSKPIESGTRMKKLTLPDQFLTPPHDKIHLKRWWNLDCDQSGQERDSCRSHQSVYITSEKIKGEDICSVDITSADWVHIKFWYTGDFIEYYIKIGHILS